MLGAHEVGMLRALADRSIAPDVILGTSIGAVNGAFFAADPPTSGVERLIELWLEVNRAGRDQGANLRRLANTIGANLHGSSGDISMGSDTRVSNALNAALVALAEFDEWPHERQ